MWRRVDRADFLRLGALECCIGSLARALHGLLSLWLRRTAPWLVLRILAIHVAARLRPDHTARPAYHWLLQRLLCRQPRRGRERQTSTMESLLRPRNHSDHPRSVSKGPQASGMERCCGTLRCLRDAGHVDMLSRVPLKAPSAPSAERQAAIEGAFAQLLTLRRAYDSLNLSDESSSHAPQPVQSTSPLEISAPGLPLGWLSPERLPSVAEHIRAYMRQRGLKHAKFAEFVMLCRDFVQR